MVLEVALIDVRPGSETAFAESYRQVRGAISDSPGCLSMRMTAGVETPTRFVLMVEWESIAAHEAFRASDRCGVWRGGIGPHFAEAPRVEHFLDVE